MSPTGFEPAIPASERTQTNALDRVASPISVYFLSMEIYVQLASLFEK
jgi:hypothetical protein